MMASASRRGIVCGFFALPFAGSVAAAAPPSNLAQACDWAIQHRDWLNRTCIIEEWDDEELGRQSDRHEAIIVRAIEEPSRQPGDVAAKARLILNDLTQGGTADSEFNDDRLLVVVLKEVIASCA